MFSSSSCGSKAVQDPVPFIREILRSAVRLQDDECEMTLSGPHFGPASGNTPKQLIILLHGLGADGADLIDLAPAIAQVFPDALFVAPNAPERCDMSPHGYQWFSLQDRTPAVMFAGATKAEAALDAFIQETQKQHGLTNAQTALIGFSQGTMMALHSGLRRASALAGIVGFSGALLGSESLPGHIDSKPPVCLIHGEQDMVVPFLALGLAETALKAANVPVETHKRPMLGHGIDEQGLEAAVRFLLRVFGV